ncbi:transposase [Streptomyces sp. HUAS TT20]|uniref:transposase n=1 Tax=Streptomyces sp. HUAS TT20 TaxID=3447509 RepID=UPI003986F100
MCRHELTDREWGSLAPLIPQAVTGRPRVDDRRIVNGMVYKIRTSISWRDLPERYESWKTVYTRFPATRSMDASPVLCSRSRPGADAAGDIDWLVQVDIVRAHQHAADTGREGGSTSGTNRTITRSAGPEADRPPKSTRLRR